LGAAADTFDKNSPRRPVLPEYDNSPTFSQLEQQATQDAAERAAEDVGRALEDY
jgi:hypothetical protein